ncbi:hypothetical protein [Stenotrophomonas acidaminiphila]|uniref:hypothetical protein n=1 Tax=Stenotrophomonas acidaminiphila TaxID=128780 RepID=UPI0028AAA3C0|nr:hypothetical protein [Stenotrophomonas acidaminiphila]
MFNRRIGLLQALSTSLFRLAGGPTLRPDPLGTTPRTVEKTHKNGCVNSNWLSARRRWLNRWAPEGGGARERARRRRQIAAGTLNSSNGLVPFITD